MPRLSDNRIEWQPSQQCYQITYRGHCLSFDTEQAQAQLRKFIDDVDSFHFSSREGLTATFRRETVQRGSNYWRAYRRMGGRLRKLHVGKSGDITLKLLEDVTQHLNAKTEVDRERAREAQREQAKVRSVEKARLYVIEKARLKELERQMREAQAEAFKPYLKRSFLAKEAALERFRRFPSTETYKAAEKACEEYGDDVFSAMGIGLLYEIEPLQQEALRERDAGLITV